MLIAKDLVIKGLIGVGVCTLGGGGIIYYNNIKNKTNKKSEPTDAELIKSVGLNCGNGTFGDTGTECSITENKLNVKHEELKKVEGLSSDESQTSTKGKIKVYRDSEENSKYERKLKFVIEEGNISVRGGTTSHSISKLEEFETYEIKQDADKWYLSRKDKNSEKIRKNLNLGEASCELPTNGDPKSCTLDATKLKAINFEGKKDGGATIEANGTATLTISKDDYSLFPFGYRFSLQPNKKVTISNTVSVEENTKVDFKIKKTNGNFTLEKAWELSKLAEKAGLDCSNNSECSIKEGGLNVNRGGTKSESKKKSTTKGTNGGKIKAYKDDKGKGYENGFKFVIEEGNIALNNGSSIKLEEFETYEIKEDTGKWYLTRKSKSSKWIEKALGIPNGCELPNGNNNTKTCGDLDKAKLKSINFEGKDSTKEPTFTVSDKKATLKITKLTTADNNFPFNYKFELESNDSDITIPKTGNNQNITIKKKTNTEFKIKKNTSDKKSLTLEKAWNVTELGKKVGLTCPATNGGSTKECTLVDGQINFYKDGSNKMENAKVKDANGKKVIYVEDAENHNQGFKFTVENDIELTKNGGSGNTTTLKIEKGNGTDTSYEIKEKDNKWYLYKKGAN